MARAALVAAGAVLLIAGSAIAGYGLTRKPSGGLTPKASQAMASSIGQLDGDVKAARASVKERAATFASLLPVQAALSTDPTTLSSRIDEITATLGGTSQWIRDQQQMFGAMEDLLSEPPLPRAVPQKERQ